MTLLPRLAHFVLLATVICAGSLSAQGSYSTYGTGCKGSGLTNQSCYGQNQNGGTFRFQPQTSVQFALRFTPTTNTTVVGFELYMRTQTAATASFSTQIFAAGSSGKPMDPPLRTSSMVVRSTLAFYRTTFAPLPVQQGKTYFIGYHGNKQVYFPHILRANTSQHLWRSSSTSTWSGPWTNPYWSWRVLCASGGAIPALSSLSAPQIGKTFSVDLNRAASNTSALLIFGASNINIDLTRAGAPGCSILAFPFVALLPTVTSGSGKASLPSPPFLIPQNPNCFRNTHLSVLRP